MPGPPRKPTILKIVTGNPGRRPLNAREPTPELGIPSVPDHLSDEAKAEWDRVVRALDRMGVLTQMDRAALAAYCQAYGDWVEAEGQLRKYGKVVKSPGKTTVRRVKGEEVTETAGGYPIQSPFLAIRNRALETMHRFLIEFGMTPSSRSRITALPIQSDETNIAAKYF